jgi:superfamily II helicase
MAIMLDDEYPTEEQRSVVRFLWAKGFNAKDIHKEIFSVYGGKCLLHKAVPNGSGNSLVEIRKSQMMPDQVQKWLRQQSKDFYSLGFEALVKQWDNCTRHTNKVSSVCKYCRCNAAVTMVFMRAEFVGPFGSHRCNL